MRSVLTNRLARRVLKWKPSVPLRDGLSLTAEFFRNEG
jgi:nucleoside-diphosphate-sugar epimerase